jgi:hypothetical protein
MKSVTKKPVRVLRMNKKGSTNIPWEEMLGLTVLIIVVMGVSPGIIKGCSTAKSINIAEQDQNNFEILIAQINALRVEDGKKEFPLSISEDYQIETYKKCTNEETPTTNRCASRPKICIKYVKNDKKAPHCQYIENTEFEPTTITASNGLTMKKINQEGVSITSITPLTDS